MCVASGLAGLCGREHTRTRFEQEEVETLPGPLPHQISLGPVGPGLVSERAKT